MQDYSNELITEKLDTEDKMVVKQEPVEMESPAKLPASTSLVPQKLDDKFWADVGDREGEWLFDRSQVCILLQHQ